MCQCCKCPLKKSFPDEFLFKESSRKIQSPFSKWIRERMEQKKITLTELSILAGVPKSTLHGWIYGRVDRLMERQNNLRYHLESF